MGRKPTDNTQAEFLEYLRSGRDEMNLLEHSIASASKDVDHNTRSLAFSRDDRDPESGEPVKRIWDVSFSAKYGRPTTRDDDVFVACMKLSSAQDFTSPRIEFTRYELCRLLGWDICGKSYKAIDDAFNRLAGVLIVATNYWYDNKAKIWVDRKFGIIDDVFLYQREKFDRAKKAAGGKNPQSWFRWSDVMQESFAAGYIRKLDLEVYLSLQNPIARKLYRYLGKHFWNRSRHAIDLQELCHEKLGYSQMEKRNPRLRQKIAPAIEELEEKGIYGLTHEFLASYGKCEVVFHAKRENRTKEKQRTPANPLVERLVKCGLDRGDAIAAVQRLDAERIVEDIEHMEFEAKAGRVKTSKAGFLVTMLKSGEAWPRPAGFVSSLARMAAAKRAAELKAKREAEAAVEEARRRDKEVAELAAFNEFMAALPSDSAREAFQEAALGRNPFVSQQYRQALKNGSSDMAAMYLQVALHSAWKDAAKGHGVGNGTQGGTSAGEVQKSNRF